MVFARRAELITHSSEREVRVAYGSGKREKWRY